MTKQVDVELVIRGPAGVSRLHLRVDTGPMRLAALARLAHEVTNEVVARSIAHDESQGHHLSCAGGCGACCCQLAPLSGPEALALVDHIMARPEPEQDEVIARYEAAKRTVVERGMAAKLDALMGDLTHLDLSAIAADYFGMGVPCFLLANDACRVYEARPLICREYNVTTPPQWCADHSLGVVRTVPTPPGMSQPLAAAMAQLIGQPPQLIPLPRVFDWVRDHEARYHRTWPGLDLFKALAAQLSSP